ncbi:MAG TPA: C40 family peptidase [Actinomycetota bacterium]|nr:C40 family peptidase [Actinomycetota bacterium]
MSGFRTCCRTVLSCALLIAVAVGFPGPASADTKKDAALHRKHVKRRAKSEIGTPYSYGGDSQGGFDCSGFSRWVFDNHGARLPHSSVEQYRLGTSRGHKRIEKRSRLRVGDLVFHKTTSARVGHVGVFIGNGKFISATSSGGVRTRSVWDPYYWGPRWVGATRLPATTGG